MGYWKATNEHSSGGKLDVPRTWPQTYTHVRACPACRRETSAESGDCGGLGSGSVRHHTTAQTDRQITQPASQSVLCRTTKSQRTCSSTRLARGARAHHHGDSVGGVGVAWAPEPDRNRGTRRSESSVIGVVVQTLILVRHAGSVGSDRGQRVRAERAHFAARLGWHRSRSGK